MKWKQILMIISISAVTALGSVWIYDTYFKSQTVNLQGKDKIPSNYAGFFDTEKIAEPLDFTSASEAALPAVVHIKTKIAAKKISNNLPRQRRGVFDDMFEDFFNNQGQGIMPEQRASGSGVIISEDGYIVTNNHVISNGQDGVAEEITVTLHNKKTYKARLIGKDPSTDLAVLKIDGKALPYIIYGNSDNVKVGQWVLAVGYPLTLDITVTAGIVGAKGRSIDINRRQSNTPIESFIQTDAAVNQGNSGGALINTRGELIGINSAILAPNGTYAGYSFAIPVNLVKKIINDIIQYGDVQRAFLGISSSNEILDEGGGAFVGTVSKDGAAAAAGIKPGDLIIKINDIAINSWAELQGTVASYRIGEKIKLTYKRNGKEYTTIANLKNKIGNYDEVAVLNIADKLGAELVNLDKTKAKLYNINGGVVVKSIKEGGPVSRTRIMESFIITSVNGKEIASVDELNAAISSIYGPVRLEGIYPGYDGIYTYPLNLE